MWIKRNKRQMASNEKAFIKIIADEKFESSSFFSAEKETAARHTH
jgi:hypothetical protein